MITWAYAFDALSGWGKNRVASLDWTMTTGSRVLPLSCDRAYNLQISRGVIACLPAGRHGHD
jgi:hypothetical protein